MLGLLLGAGFSKWAANLPLASELFDWDIAPQNRRDERRLERIVELKASWDKSNPNGLSEQFVSDAIRTSERVRRLVSWYVTRRLSDPFIGRMLGGTQALMIDDRRRFQHEGIRAAQAFLEQFSSMPASGIVTTNYDLLIEYALGTDAFNYGVRGQVLTGRGKNPWFPWQGTPVTLDGKLSVAKLHGSVSWDKEHFYTDGRCGVKGDALIVPPEPDKARPAVLEPAWRLAESILASSRRLLVFGFAFNAYGDQARSLLSEAGRRINSVLLVDPDPKLPDAHTIWPVADIATCLPPPRGTDCVAGWIV